MTRAPFRKFDIRGLHAALDVERLARGLSWVTLVAEINKPFVGTPSIPISVGTVRSMLDKRSVTSDVVLQILRWLRRAPESFLAGSDAAPLANEILPEPGPGRILRFDTRAMDAALNAERLSRGMTWKQVAGETSGFTPKHADQPGKGSFDWVSQGDDDSPMVAPASGKFRTRSWPMSNWKCLIQLTRKDWCG